MKNLGIKAGIATLAATLFAACSPKQDDRVGATPDNPMVVSTNVNVCSTQANLTSVELRSAKQWEKDKTLWVKCEHKDPNNRGNHSTLFSCTPTFSSLDCVEEYRHPTPK